MKNLTLDIDVPADRRIVVQLPEDIEPGRARLVLISAKRPMRASPDSDPLADFPSLHVESWPSGFSFRREEIYGDDGR